MSRFGVFALMYMTAILLELMERWRHPGPALLTLALVAAIAWSGVTRPRFLLFLGLTTAYLLTLFPDVANHVNIIVYCNLLLMVGLGWSLIRPSPDDDGGFDLVRPVLQASMILVYSLAGFAKLNRDFLNPSVSCVGDMVGDLTSLVRSRAAGVPTLLLLLAGALLLAGWLLRRRFRPAVLAAAGAAILAAGAVAIRLLPGLARDFGIPFVLGMAGLVILWELVLGPLLARRETQLPVLLFSWSMHATLALIGFVDFGALALTLLLTFVPREWLDLVRAPTGLRLLGRPLERGQLYFLVCLVAGAASASGHRFPAGVAFNVAALVLLYPMLAAALSARRPAWPGVPIRGASTPAWLYLIPLALDLHGATSYLGLRTAGNFTMFSNLRTEGERSNHLLLGANPFKWWHYQEDVVRVIRLDDRQAMIGYNYQPLEGNTLPVVEFRKLVHWWTEAGRRVSITFEYGGTTYATDDIAQEAAWRSRGRDWEMRLMDFRIIQGAGPNRCRW